MSTDEPEERVTQISVVVPVRNEEKSIRTLLQALVQQSYSPAEIVITDGGSDDRTRELIRDFANRSPIPIVLIETAHAFPGRGRNLGIAGARRDWIACIDAGNVPDRNWLKELVAAANRETEASIVYGRYVPVMDTYFASCAAIAYLLPPNTFAPSIVSTLMHRSVWQQAEGFREDLRSGEDLLFFRAVAALGIPSARADKALVHWSLQPSLAPTFRRFKTYSRYGMQAGLGTEWQLRVTSLYLLLLMFVAASWYWWPLALVPAATLIIRSQRRIYSWYASVSGNGWAEMLNPRRVLTVACINIVIDIAMFCGMVAWFSRSWTEPELKISNQT